MANSLGGTESVTVTAAAAEGLMRGPLTMATPDSFRM
jgi:hypothetical protein